MKNILHRFVLVLFGIMYSLSELLAQSPTHIDTRRKDPNPFTLDDILLYIVFPVLLFIAAYFGRRYQKKLQQQKNAAED
jgi:hypothetical protein